MSAFWPEDVNDMHWKFGFKESVASFDAEKMKKLYEFRKTMLREEMKELEEATNAKDAADALIDLIVFAIGTLDIFDVDMWVAWDEVNRANMEKVRGVKPNRPNPLGLPDLLKPEGWTAPDWSDIDVGRLPEVFDE